MDQPELFDAQPPKKRGAGTPHAPAPPATASAVPVPPGASPPAEMLPAGALPSDGPLKRMIDGNFLQYASYVIRDRAIPEIDDGLKPVQRRIMYSLHRNDDGKFTKVANIVGHAMQYHPHGDASIGEALVALTNRQYLIEGQGNFGNVFTGDPAAASRYIECRLTEMARNEIFNDELTDFVPTYDGRGKEPVKLPAKLPLLLMLGAEGIAVGLSTRILPHNFGELIAAQIAILNKKPFKLVPDFQQGGRMDASEYEKGNGRVRLRAVIERRDDQALVIREIPFGTTTDSVIASIEDAARKKKILIQSISDFTSGKIEIEIKLPAGQDAEKAIQALYAFTQCEAAISSRSVVIRDNRPVEMNVDDILRHNTERLVSLLKAELQAERHRLLEEFHRKTLVQIFVENRIYKRIEEKKTYPEVQKAVLSGVNEFRSQLRRDVTTQDVEMLLGIPIRRISAFDINKNRQEIEEILAGLGKAEKDLKELVPYAIRYLKLILKKYGEAYPRHTQTDRFDNIEIRELTAGECRLCYDREKGYLGHAIPGDSMLECSSYDKIILVWEGGQYKVIPPPEKLFVGPDLIYCAVADRDRPILIVYTEEDGFTYLKRFSFGGTILNKDYMCTPENSRVLLFADDNPPEIYVKYKPDPRLRIHQKVFRIGDLALHGAKARGVQMTAKRIQSVSTRKPRSWDDTVQTPPGVLM